MVGREAREQLTHVRVYLTLPLFIYDYVLLGWYFELGIMFVVPYWYLTFFYFSFWLQFPLIGYLLERKDDKSRI